MEDIVKLGVVAAAAIVSIGGVLWVMSHHAPTSVPSTQFSICYISSCGGIETNYQPLSSSVPVTMTTYIPKYLMVDIRDGDRKVYDKVAQIQISFFSVSPPFLEMPSVMDIHPENNFKKPGSSVFSIVPKNIGNFNMRISLNGKEINTFPVLVNSDQLLYDEFPIIIDPVLDGCLIFFPKHSDKVSMRISDINYPPLIEAIATTQDYWPRGPKQLYYVVLDHGRSHYFFTNGSDQIPCLIHKYGFRNFGTATPEQCVSFFEDLGIPGNDVLRRFEEGPTPIRSNLLTRIKYELLRKFLSENGKTQQIASELSIGILAGTTQHTLSYLKHRILDSLPEPLQSVIRFTWYRVNIILQNEINNHVFLEVTFLNFLPPSGTWQICGEIPLRNNRKKIRAEFFIDLENSGDNGKIRISILGDHDDFGKVGPDVGGDKYGIYRADFGDVIKFRDTAPTW